MTVQGIGFVGMRTPKMNEFVSLFRDCLEIPLTHESPTKIGFTLENGLKLELYGPGDKFHSFFNTGPVVGFSVSDFENSKKRMVDIGVEFIGNVQNADGETWQHFYLPDGTVAEIIETVKP